MQVTVEDCSLTEKNSCFKNIIYSGRMAGRGSISNTRNTNNTRNASNTRNPSNHRNVSAAGNAGTRGSITVEASIIVPLVILAIAAAIYIGLLLYQRALVQSAAEQAAEAGAIAWSTGTFELRTGKPMEDSFEKFALYRRLFDSEKESRLESIEQYALSAAGHHEIVRAVNTDVQAVIKDYVVCRKIEVTIRKEYNLPFGKFLKLFGGSNVFEITVKVVSALDEPAELIRTTDFIIDIEKKLEKQFPELNDIGDKTRNVLNEIKDKLDEFME